MKKDRPKKTTTLKLTKETLKHLSVSSGVRAGALGAPTQCTCDKWCTLGG